ncbi:pyroglutamyl-peptidase I . Cysteine peptidase. MEROPS family C15 [Arthrobacter sp. cf158]|uniref:pyroglutamyl-peptidase I n=1 Tax=Arthrobacter sp. cf158 TaxID=1761744 RepID=UPI00089C8576|nr:pyroglutamyl-peptidase I [Arthrobacter sp. cf158]SDX42554.1 pyroglutamyl-peptidase I . Cysteine peptidase. MEROPS family C15 [Arthrobacter sp. cf158]
MILLTGFEPFGGDEVNSSWLAALRAQDILRAEGLAVESVELPCVFGESAVVLEAAMARLRPDVVVCIGLAGGRERVSLERVAINCDDARIPDNKGQRPIDQEVIDGGPAAYFSSLPIKAALRNLQIAGIKGEVSQSAGTYVCNHVFYALMHSLASRPGVLGGFVHVPYLPEHLPAGSTAPSLSLESMAEGIAVIVRTALQPQGDIKISAGTIH